MTEGGDAGAVEQEARRRERRTYVVLAVVLVVTVVGSGVVGGILTARADGDRGGEGLAPALWLILVAVLVVMAVVIVAITFAFVWWRRRRGSALFARSPLWELPDRRSRNALVKALRRGEPIPPEQHELAHRVTRDIIGRRGLIWVFLVLALLQGLSAVLRTDESFDWLPIAAGPMFLLFAGYFGWLIHRMRRAQRRLDAEAAPD